MKIVLAHGVFDLFHAGHVNHLEQARNFGDKLVVSLVADEFVAKRKVIYSQDERRAILQALSCVEDVLLCMAPGPEGLLRAVRPAFYVRNDEYLNQDRPEYKICRELGILIGFTHTYPPHTSDIIRRITGK